MPFIQFIHKPKNELESGGRRSAVQCRRERAGQALPQLPQGDSAESALFQRQHLRLRLSLPHERPPASDLSGGRGQLCRAGRGDCLPGCAGLPGLRAEAGVLPAMPAARWRRCSAARPRLAGSAAALFLMEPYFMMGSAWAAPWARRLPVCSRRPCSSACPWWAIRSPAARGCRRACCP